MDFNIIHNELVIREDNCIGCNWCLFVCPTNAITIQRKTLTVDGWSGETKIKPLIDEGSCVLVGSCTEVCVTSALYFLSEGPWNGPRGGSGNGNGNGNTNNPETPCQAAEKPTEKATELSKNQAYISSITSIQAYNDGVEHGVILGSVNGSIIPTEIQHGSSSSLSLSHDFSNPIASIHSHITNTPPSPGDVYHLITSNIKYPTFNTSYLATANGTTYALVITNPDKMADFYRNNPPNQAQPGMSPNFPLQMFDDWVDFTINELGNSEMALAYVLDKYNSGIALSKMNPNNNFSKVNPVKNSNGTYSQANCK